MSKEDTYVNCCRKCPNKMIKHEFCYNGESSHNCPAYNLLPDIPGNEPPDDIIEMLN